MAVVLVLVAHSGRTLQLGSVLPSTPVAALQEVVQELTGIQPSEQIFMCRGTRLDPARQLSSYQLPAGVQAGAEDSPVFLYNRVYIRPGATPPPAEEAPEFTPHVPCVEEVSEEHPLLKAKRSELRQLPWYEVQFRHHQITAQEYWEVSQKYFHRCQQLLSEQEVQSRAIDAARANIQVYYNAISAAFNSFLEGYSKQRDSHGDLLERFEGDMEVLRSTELHPRLQEDGCMRLVDLVPEGRLCKWWESCRKAHKHFSEKVANLEALFSALKRDVESLFMQAPSVDLDDLGRVLGTKEDLLEEHGLIMQALNKDLAMVRQLVEDSVKSWGSDMGDDESMLDGCSVVENMHASHTERLVPRLKECMALLGEFCLDCLDCKNKMTIEIVSQMQQISVQQSRIRDVKNKLAAFHEVHSKQEEAIAELILVRRIPAAYKAALSECVRRKAWTEMYSGQATRLAEHMDKVWSKEVAKRDALQRETECILPLELLKKMGLTKNPPQCEICIPAQEEDLLPVTINGVKKIGVLAKSSMAATDERGVSKEDSEGDVGGSFLEQMNSKPQSVDPVVEKRDLQLENAKLRADLACHIAHHNLQSIDNPQFTRESGDFKLEKESVTLKGVGGEKFENESQRWKEALQHQEDLNAILESRLGTASSLNHKYEARIQELLENLDMLRNRASSLEKDLSSANVVTLNITVSPHPDSD